MARFLVVDDEVNTVSALQTLLQDDGHEVYACTAGPDAVSALDSREFDAVLADVDMQRVSGQDVVRLARSRHPRACIFVNTARPRLAAPHEACHVFSKPLDYSRMTKIVARCRAQSGPGRHGRCYMKDIKAPE